MGHCSYGVLYGLVTMVTLWAVSWQHGDHWLWQQTLWQRTLLRGPSVKYSLSSQKNSWDICCPLWRLLTSLLPVSVFTLSWCLCCDIYRPSPWHHDHLHDSLLVVAVTGVMATLSPVECGHFSHQVASRTPTNQRPVRVDSDQWEGDSGSGDVGAGPRDTPAPLPRPRTVKLR